MNNVLNDFDYAVSLKRPHGGVGVSKLCDYICKRIKKYSRHDYTIDYAGNIHVDNRKIILNDVKYRVEYSSYTLFTAHVDTVHKSDGPNDFIIEGNLYKANGAPLGADDAAGISILLHLIDNNVPGYYVFTQGEEVGGIGSSWLAKNQREKFSVFKRAVAFDRRGYYDIITHQAGGRCASDTFAEQLAQEFASIDETLLFMPSNTGIYTDTAEFMEFIPECTNISVGYDMEHSPKESQDIVFLSTLAKAAAKVNWEKLNDVRNPAIPELTYPSYKSVLSAVTKSISYDYDEYLDSLTSEEDELAMCLCEAEVNNNTNLKEMIGELLCPDNPDVITSNLKIHRLKKKDLKDAFEMLDLGQSAGEVAEELYNRCAVI